MGLAERIRLRGFFAGLFLLGFFHLLFELCALPGLGLFALLALPLLNYFAPELMATRVAGFTLSWLILGVLFFPFVWIISYTFIKRSIALEEDEVNSVKR